MAGHPTTLRFRPPLQSLERFALRFTAVHGRLGKLVAKERRRVAVVGADVDRMVIEPSRVSGLLPQGQTMIAPTSAYQAPRLFKILTYQRSRLVGREFW